MPSPETRSLIYNDNDNWCFYCPGCRHVHCYLKSFNWEFNNDLLRPTFNPSLLNITSETRCHLFILDGEIKYCSDCTHELAGQTVPMEVFRW